MPEVLQHQTSNYTTEPQEQAGTVLAPNSHEDQWGRGPRHRHQNHSLEKRPLQQMVLEKLDIHLQMTEIRSKSLTLY
jgi:hypothetical protein